MDAHPDRTDGLRDPQGRVLNYLRLSITERCDLRCSYCRTDGADHSGADAMTLEDIRAVGVAFARHLGFRKVRVTGGEPLLRPDLPAIVRALREVAGFERVALTTNGRLLADAVRGLAAAGLDQVNVSLDTLCEGAYREIRGVDAFGAVTRGIETALDAGLRRVKVNVVLLRSFGFAEFDSFLAWGRGRPLEVRFIELMPIEGRSEFHEREHMSSEPLIERVLADGFAPVGRDGPGGPAVVYQRPGDPLRVGFVSPITRPFCAECNRLRVTSRGALKLCLFGAGFVDLLPAARLGPQAVAQVVHRAVVLREDGVRSQGRPIPCQAGMRGIGG